MCQKLNESKETYWVKSATKLIVIFGFQYETHSTGPSSLESSSLESSSSSGSSTT